MQMIHYKKQILKSKCSWLTWTTSCHVRDTLFTCKINCAIGVFSTQETLWTRHYISLNILDGILVKITPRPSFDCSICVIDRFSLHWYPQPLFATKPQQPRHPDVDHLRFVLLAPLFSSCDTIPLFCLSVGCWFYIYFCVFLLFVTLVVIRLALNFKVSRFNKKVILDSSMPEVLDYHIHLNRPVFRLPYMLNCNNKTVMVNLIISILQHFPPLIVLKFEVDPTNGNKN